MSKAIAVLLCAYLGLACNDEIELNACDIREASCRQDVFLAVARVRGTAWDPWLDLPPMRVITKDQYRAEIEAHNAARAKQPSGHDYFTPAYKRFALIDPDEAPDESTSFTVSFVAAYYDSFSDSVTIIDRGSEADNKRDTVVLAHELVHAAQQRDVGFGVISRWGQSSDNVNARGALIEGEAKLYENLVDLLLRKLPADHIDWAGYHAKWIHDERSKIAEDPSPWRRASSGFRYPLGSQYLTSAWLDGGPPGVRRALANHPTATRRLLGERNGPLDVPEAPWPCKTPPAPNGYKLIDATTLGAWGVYAFATRLTEEADAFHYGEQWVGDEFAVYANPDNQVAVIWRIRLQDPARVAALASGVEKFDKIKLEQALDGDRVSFAAADDPALWDDTDWMSCDPR